MRGRRAGRLVLLGLGTDPRAHLTVETLQAARLCDRVFTGGLDAREEAGLRRAVGNRRCRKLPARGASRTLMAHLGRGLRVGLASPLHPLLWSDLAPDLLRRCRASRTTWESFGAVLPGTVCVAASGLGLGVGHLGLQSVSASLLAEPDFALSGKWPAVAYFTAPRERRLWRKVLTRLGGAYGPECGALLWRPGQKSRRATLSRLGAMPPPRGTVLVCVIPPK